MGNHKLFTTTAIVIAAAIVATLTLALAAGAAQPVTTPDKTTLSYSLHPGATSVAITLVPNLPVFVIADQTVPPNVGSSSMTIVSSPTQDQGELIWNGIESNGGGFTSGAGSVPLTHIMYIDAVHDVDIEVNSSTSIVVHNSSSLLQTGTVTLIW